MGLPTPPALPDLAGQLFDNRYRMVKPIGEGGMGFVYLAHDTSTDAQVAIKVILPSLRDDATARGRVRQEAALGAKLAHPNVCHIIHYGETSDGAAYVVMPFVEGEALCDITWRAGQLPLDVTARYVRDICAGLHVAHEAGIIHRDLKPENIIIVRNADGSERAVLLDFGLATTQRRNADDPRLTTAGMVVGTPEFMSPEQMRGHAVDRRSDIYSLAFIAYEMLTGQLPFEAKTLREFGIARLKGELIPIRERRPDLDFPPAVEKVLAKALAVDVKRRYATAPKFGEALARAASPNRAGDFFRSLLGR